MITPSQPLAPESPHAPGAPQVCLRAVGVSRDYGRRRALADVSFECRRGEIVGILGPNGAGKSTLLALVATLARPSAGRIDYGDVPARPSAARIDYGDVPARPSAERAAEARAGLGVLSHELFLYPELTARENLQFFARLYGVTAVDLRVTAALEAAHLEARADDRVAGFSHGMRQRLAFERAVIHEPRFLLLDEPFTGLDDASTARLVERLRGLRASGVGVLLATHDLGLVEGLLDRAVILRAGRASIVEAPGAALRAHYAHVVHGAPRPAAGASAVALRTSADRQHAAPFDSPDRSPSANGQARSWQAEHPVAPSTPHSVASTAAPSTRHPAPEHAAPSTRHPAPEHAAPSTGHPAPEHAAPSTLHSAPEHAAPSTRHLAPEHPAPSTRHLAPERPAPRTPHLAPDIAPPPTLATFFLVAWHVFRKDLLIETRSREVIATTLFFAAACVLVFSFGFVDGGRPVREAVGAILWIAVAFSGTLALGRVFERERADAALEGLLLAPVSRAAIYVGKLWGILALMAAVEAVVLLLVVLFFQVRAVAQPLLLVALLAAATVGFAAVGALFAAMLARARSREVLLPILLYPMTVPVLMAGVRGTVPLIDPSQGEATAVMWLAMLIFFDTVFLTLALWTFEALLTE